MTRDVVDVSRSQVDRRGVSDTRSLRESIMVLERRELGFSEEVHVAPKKDACYVEWELRFGLTEVREGLDREFLERYKLFTKSGSIEHFPGMLRDALVKVSQYFVAKRITVTLKFQKDGWGICTGVRIYKLKDMESLLEIADEISTAVT